MPEGDTIHRIAARFDASLVGCRLERAEAPNPRSPLHNRASRLGGLILERAEAKGKHLLLHFEGDLVLHNHLGMNGRWFIAADGRDAYGRPWLALGAGPAIAALNGGKILRLVRAQQARNDPALRSLGPDPLGPGFDEEAAAGRLAGWEPTEQVGAALLDQQLLAGIGNVIRIEALFSSAVNPWRRVGDLTKEEATSLVHHSLRIMQTAVRTGRRPKQIYGALARRPCPRCGAKIRRRGQGDDARVTYWCEGCQL